MLLHVLSFTIFIASYFIVCTGQTLFIFSSVDTHLDVSTF